MTRVVVLALALIVFFLAGCSSPEQAEPAPPAPESEGPDVQKWIKSDGPRTMRINVDLDGVEVDDVLWQFARQGTPHEGGFLVTTLIGSLGIESFESPEDYEQALERALKPHGWIVAGRVGGRLWVKPAGPGR